MRLLLQKLKISKLLQKNCTDDVSLSPQGVSFMWSGQHQLFQVVGLCDGTGTTPDLRGRFIVGVSASGGYC